MKKTSPEKKEATEAQVFILKESAKTIAWHYAQRMAAQNVTEEAVIKWVSENSETILDEINQLSGLVIQDLKKSAN